MEITARGRTRSRSLWNHEVGVVDLKERKISRTPEGWEDLHVNKDVGSVTVRWDQDIQMSGRYSFRMTLLREDIARLFVASMSDVPMEKVVQLLSGSGEERPDADEAQTPPP